MTVGLGGLQVRAALDLVSERIGRANQSFDRSIRGDTYGESNAEWYLRIADVQLLALTETLGLATLRAEIARDFATALTEGLLKTDKDVDGEPELRWATTARQYSLALEGVYASHASHTITRDLESILRQMTYARSSLTTRPGGFRGPVTARVARLPRL
jgi:hypothetical protein